VDTKPGIDELLIRSAIEPDLQRRLRESPDDVFGDFDLSAEEKEILRRPDHRLLPLLGAALARHTPDASPAATPEPQVAVQARSLPDLSLALTIVPCVREQNGAFQGFTYAAWVSPLPASADPSTLPPPTGAALPGKPCPPLYATISVSAVELRDSAGNPQAALWASLRQASNVTTLPPVEVAGRPDASPFGSDFTSSAVREAVAAVRAAPPGERYAPLLSLLRTLRTGDVV
jgi:hypothetical protein